MAAIGPGRAGGGGWGVMMCGPDEYIGSLCTLAPSTEMCGTHGSSNAVETETRPYLLATPIASEAQPLEQTRNLIQQALSTCHPNSKDSSHFPKIRVPYFEVLIIRILLFRVLYSGPLFSETPTFILGRPPCALQAA